MQAPFNTTDHIYELLCDSIRIEDDPENDIESMTDAIEDVQRFNRINNTHYDPYACIKYFLALTSTERLLHKYFNEK